MLNIAIVTDITSGQVVKVFHGETRATVMRLAVKSLFFAPRSPCPIAVTVTGLPAIEVDVDDPFTHTLWRMPNGQRVRITTHVSYARMERSFLL